MGSWRSEQSWDGSVTPVAGRRRPRIKRTSVSQKLLGVSAALMIYVYGLAHRAATWHALAPKNTPPCSALLERPQTAPAVRTSVRKCHGWHSYVYKAKHKLLPPSKQVVCHVVSWVITDGLSGCADENLSAVLVAPSAAPPPDSMFCCFRSKRCRHRHNGEH